MRGDSRTDTALLCEADTSDNNQKTVPSSPRRQGSRAFVIVTMLISLPYLAWRRKRTSAAEPITTSATRNLK